MSTTRPAIPDTNHSCADLGDHDRDPLLARGLRERVVAQPRPRHLAHLHARAGDRAAEEVARRAAARTPPARRPAPPWRTRRRCSSACRWRARRSCRRAGGRPPCRPRARPRRAGRAVRARRRRGRRARGGSPPCRTGCDRARAHHTRSRIMEHVFQNAVRGCMSHNGRAPRRSGAAMASQVEVDPQETREWLEALDAVVNSDGPQRAQFLLERVVGHAQLTGAAPAPAGTTPYLNTIPPQDEPPHPVDEALERRVRSIVRWNAIATILNANKTSSELGGHIARYQSAAVLYETGFNHFWHAPSTSTAATSSSCRATPRRASTRARSSRAASPRSRCASSAWRSAAAGSPSYPHPWLMPDFWQFPTVSMGLGPLMAIYQARFMKYLQGRGPGRDRRPQGVGVHGRRRDGRAGVARRDLDGRPRASRQPDLRHQLQPAAARRPGARQRQDHPGARDELPRRGLERRSR